jgi:hypothetical protein
MDHVRFQRRFLHRDVERIAATHAPSGCAQTLSIHIRLVLQEHDCGVQVALGAVLRNPRDLVSLLRCGRHFAAIRINRQCDLALIGEFEAGSLRLIL